MDYLYSKSNNLLVIYNDAGLKSLADLYSCDSLERLKEVLTGIKVIDARDSQMTEIDAQHDPDFFNGEMTMGELEETLNSRIF